MGLFSKIFGKSSNQDNFLSSEPKTFVDCVDIINAWKTRATIDPDLMMQNDPALNVVMESKVSCPYCAKEMYFRDAIVGSGINMKVVCPACQTEPVVHHEY